MKLMEVGILADCKACRSFQVVPLVSATPDSWSLRASLNSPYCLISLGKEGTSEYSQFQGLLEAFVLFTA